MNISKIVEELKKGNLVITPTDTVYGIMGDALNDNAINNVFLAKKRDNTKPLIILVSNKKMLLEYVVIDNYLEQELIDKYMPGKLTLILKKKPIISNKITNNSEFVGVRIPDNKELVKIINSLGNPVFSTSANISSKEVIVDVNQLEISYVEDGGKIVANSSTIIKVNNNKIDFLREGELANKIKSDYKLFK